MTRSTIQRLRLMAVIAVASAAAGALYAANRRSPPDSGEHAHIATGAAVGVVISSCIIGFELFAARRLLEAGGRRLPLLAAVLVRTILYGIVIISAVLLLPWASSGAKPSPVRPGIVGDIIFSIAATFVFVSLMSIAQVIGPKVLGNLLTGRYYHPREEQRIVVFLDLVGSSAIAERVGNVRFYTMLSDTFARLSGVVTDFGGEVYRYVGDALIATWPLGTPVDNARPIRCLLACQDALAAAAGDLLARHGQIPAFRAGVHAGPLVAGEIGGFKREIALVGDTMNTAARLEQICRSNGHSLLVSKPVLDCAVIPPNIVATSIGGQRLRGKSQCLELFELERMDCTNQRLTARAQGSPLPSEQRYPACPIGAGGV